VFLAVRLGRDVAHPGRNCRAVGMAGRIFPDPRRELSTKPNKNNESVGPRRAVKVAPPLQAF